MCAMFARGCQCEKEGDLLEARHWFSLSVLLSETDLSLKKLEYLTGDVVRYLRLYIDYYKPNKIDTSIITLLCDWFDMNAKLPFDAHFNQQQLSQTQLETLRQRLQQHLQQQMLTDLDVSSQREHQQPTYLCEHVAILVSHVPYSSAFVASFEYLKNVQQHLPSHVQVFIQLIVECMSEIN